MDAFGLYIILVAFGLYIISVFTCYNPILLGFSDYFNYFFFFLLSATYF